MINVLKDRNMIAALKRTMDAAWFGIDVSNRAQPPNILNGEFLTGVNAAGTATVNMLGVDANDRVVTPSGAPLAALVVSLSAAQLIAMNGAPVSIIPAPGAGKAIIVRQVVFEMIAGATPFTGGGVITLVYHGGAVAVHAGSVPAAVVTGAAGTTATELGQAVAANGTTVAANTGVDITNATAAFAAGNGTAKVHIWYHIITL
jgi:hypothetical protein